MVCLTPRRLIAAFGFALFLAAAVRSDAGPLTPVRLRLHGREIAVKTSALSDGKEVYIPLEALAQFGATGNLGAREESVMVSIRSASPVEIALARPGREPMLPLSALLKHLHLTSVTRDGVCDVDPVSSKSEPGKSATAKPAEQKQPAPDTAVKQPDNRSAAAAPTSPIAKNESPKTPSTAFTKPIVNAAVQAAQNPDRSEPAKTAPVPAKQEPRKPDGDITITLDLPKAGSPEAAPFAGASTARQSAGAVKITSVFFQRVDDATARIRINTTNKPEVNARFLRQPTKLAIDLPSTVIDTELRDIELNHPLTTGLHLGNSDQPNASRLTVDLSRLIGYSVEDPDGGGVTINLMLPRGTGKKLQGMTIAVDPGHGGKDSTGCSATVNGEVIYEKNLTLSMAKKLQRYLTEAGVDVLMTRTSDQDVSLSDRPDMANKAKADLFISIHVDDCPKPNTASGTTAYFHMDDPSSRSLAYSIAERVGAYSGLPIRGAKSDRVRFRTGMAVLRGAQMPACLVEVAYINNDLDRSKLLDSQFQSTVTKAIFDGIRRYADGVLPDD